MNISPISIQVIPRDQISEFPVYSPSSMANITSGAIQYGVPTNELAGDDIDAEPKSAVTQVKWHKTTNQKHEHNMND